MELEEVKIDQGYESEDQKSEEEKPKCIISKPKKQKKTYKLPCYKFLMAATMSLVTTGIGGILIFTHSTERELVLLGSSLISANLGFWLNPPKR